jgi:NAD(P)-dependent dehydrogenase (short-subunit alcohol dehydrogenase family)
MKNFKGGTAVITGAASGFGLETSRLAAQRGMNVVMADVQQDALERAAAEIAALGAEVLPFRLDVARAAEVEARGAATLARFGAPQIVFNNAGVGAGGLIWENTVADWEWVLGVNVMGVAHGIRVFTPMMLAAAEKDPAYEGHIVNTASMAGLLNPPNMGVYNVSKHAVVAMSETLYQDLRLESQRNRPLELAAAKPTRSQLIGKAMNDRAVGHGKVSAADVAGFVFDAIAAGRFYIYSHPKSLASVQTRLEDVVQARNPTDPFAGKPEIGTELRAALRAR